MTSESLTKAQHTVMREARNNGVAYTNQSTASALITKGLAEYASVDPQPPSGRVAVQLTLKGKSWRRA